MAMARMDQLRSIDDPVARVRAVDVAIEVARSLLAELADVRQDAVVELYESLGATAAARALGVTRETVYHAVYRKRGRAKTTPIRELHIVPPEETDGQ